jgi:transaldolase
MRSAMAKIQTSFQLDEGTADAIEKLKGVFGVTSNTAVIRKAIALSRVAARAADGADNTVTIVDREGERFKIPLNG